MGTTQPIRNKEELHKFANYYKSADRNPRNYALICVGLNTALRISDELSLKWSDVYDFDEKNTKDYIKIIESKTKKPRTILINYVMRRALLTLFNKRKKRPLPTDYIFSTDNDPSCPITRTHAYRIIRKAALATLKEPDNISCHSLRKTFGYQAWKQGADLAVLTEIFNHSTYAITKRYIGVDQTDQDSVFLCITY